MSTDNKFLFFALTVIGQRDGRAEERTREDEWRVEKSSTCAEASQVMPPLPRTEALEVQR
jgi:hypothetical protein